jgi:hypothetical protein
MHYRSIRDIYLKYWLITIAVITFLYICSFYVVDDFDDLRRNSVQFVRSHTPAYPPPLTNFLND